MAKDNKFKTIFQSLDKAISGGWNETTAKSTNKVNSYNLDSNNDIVYRTNNKADLERKKLELQQQKLITSAWRKANAELSLESLAGLTNVKIMYRDADLMDAYPEIGAALDIVAEEACLRGNTHIKLLNGQEYTIQELHEMGLNNFWVYSVDSNGNCQPALVEKVVCNGVKKIVELELDDGSIIECTDNHLWMTSDGKWVRTDKLKPNDSLMSIYDKINYLGYEKIKSTIEPKFRLTHQIVAENVLHDDKLKLSEKNIPFQKIVIHHKSFNKLNNEPSQLQYMFWNDHQKLHVDLNRERWNNPEYVCKMKKIFSETNKKTWSEKRESIINKIKDVWVERKKTLTKNEFKTIYGRKGEQNGMYGVHRYGESNPNFNKAKLHYNDIDEQEYIKYVLTLKGDYRNTIAKHFNLTKKSVENFNTYLCTKYSINKISELKYRLIDNYSIDAIKKIVREGITQKCTVAKKLNICPFNIDACCRVNGYKNWEDVVEHAYNHKIIKVNFTNKHDYVYDLLNSSVNNCFAIKCNSGQIISHNCTLNDKNKMVNVSSSSDRIKNAVEDLLVNRLDIHVTLPMICRAMCKYGNNFQLLNINENKGVMGWRQLPVYEVERYENGLDNPYAYATGNVTTENDETKFVWLGKNEQNPYRNWQVGHFRLLTDSLYLPYGVSYLNKSRRHWRMLALMEDMMLIYRLERSIERRVFKIYVGNIDDDDVEAYVNDIANNFKRSTLVDPQTGQLDLRRNILACDQDFFIPVRSEDAPNPIDTLGAAQNLTAMDDIKYVQNKILAGLRIPKTFLNFEEATGDGKNLALMDIRFTRTINRIQQALLMELNKIVTIHLFILGFTDDLTNFTLSMNNPSSQADMLEIENLQKKINTVKEAVTDPGNGIPIMSMRRALKSIMHWDDSEIIENLNEIRLEKALSAELEKTSQIIKRTGQFDQVDRIYGEPGAQYQEGGEGGPEGGDAGGGGSFGGGGGFGDSLGGDIDSLGDGGEEPEGEIGGEEGQTTVDNALNDENTSQGDNAEPLPSNESIVGKLNKKLILEHATIKNKYEKKCDYYTNIYMKKLRDSQIKREERIPLLDKAFLVNEEIDSMVNKLSKYLND